MKLVFATHNKNKFEEVRKLVPNHIELLSLTDIDCFEEISETGETLQENAKIKSDFVRKNYGLDCFSDDTGLLVDALNGEPGVYSARYAGPSKSAEANMEKILNKMGLLENRSARFETVISLHFQGIHHFFTGTVDGKIIKEKRGENGFGYDPIFMPNGYLETFAELPLEIKNKIGHRGKAMAQLMDYLKKNS
ncbi:non-canonical purine NTP diphosphatase [Croceivirga thetidis]|uniref:dITP/XTP pyrophosphatase n=1 Tax=Croceivirga thetidis TaxID=2721623 RepID=A0ABX1GRQ7_9FLAO|nr:non-canonical purine NTP diphosphatase [Croceivirga thetidis]